MSLGVQEINSILIANRGEIASRIIRTCRKMGIKSIAVYSEIDRAAPHVAEADMAIFIGKSNPIESYLNQEVILNSAVKAGADAIHPGYGFLSENASFARKCEEKNLVFIGPSASIIENMGSKSKARHLVKELNIPIVPGYDGTDQHIEILVAEATQIGFPVLLKASEGGGGKGMRLVTSAEQLLDAIESARREAKNAFGHDTLIIEKYIQSSRHIEFQIFGDKHGNAVHMFERECSIQRRYQKIIEESPSPGLTPELQEKMAVASIKLAKALAYDNAGTVEFILDNETGKYYFLEVNTRLQVEHPVTEEITGLDLVQLQIESAQGQTLRIKQEDIKRRGYAVECRLYAENPSDLYRPSPGIVGWLKMPRCNGLRIEAGIREDSEISIYYDPMMAKLIVWDKSRIGAHRKMLYALKNLVCLGLQTNQNLCIRIFESADFRQGNYDTRFLDHNETHFTRYEEETQNRILASIVATLKDWHERENSRKLLRHLPSGWRNNYYSNQKEIYVFGEDRLEVEYRFIRDRFQIKCDANEYEVRLLKVDMGRLQVEINNVSYIFHISVNKTSYMIHNESFGVISFEKKERFPNLTNEAGDGGYVSTMPSVVMKIFVMEGQQIVSGDKLVVLSSMKMESTIHASKDGIVQNVFVEEGMNIEAGHTLVSIEEIG